MKTEIITFVTYYNRKLGEYFYEKYSSTDGLVANGTDYPDQSYIEDPQWVSDICHKRCDVIDYYSENLQIFGDIVISVDPEWLRLGLDRTEFWKQ